MQGCQTRTADAYPHPGPLPVHFGLWRRVFAAQLQQCRLYAILVRYQQNEALAGIAQGKGIAISRKLFSRAEFLADSLQIQPSL